MTRIVLYVRGFQSLCYLYFISTYFNNSRRRFQMLYEKMYENILQTLPKKSLLESLFDKLQA